ncbi:MAG: aminoacyl-tRNA hydrolase [Flavobacteriales bacterium]|nr:aminoacyl-tRNA hydrolase [Flavobacteriales bacterium]
MKFLVVGLGNPGAEYENTRHNIGFIVADKLAEAAGAAFSAGRYAGVASFRIKGRTVTLIKPTTFMNLSGNAVRYWMQFENIPLEHILVITDDLALPFGKLRLRASGSAGGHNGLTHIEQTLGTQQYARLRFGIGNEFLRGKQVDYVLGTWSEEENKTLGEQVGIAAEAVHSFVLTGLTPTMNRFNKK